MIDATLLKALGGGTGGFAAAILAAMMLFPTKEVYERHEADFLAYQAASEAATLRQQISDTVERAAAEEPGEYKTSLCKSLDQAIGKLCEIADEDAMCVDRAVYRKKAGCE